MVKNISTNYLNLTLNNIGRYFSNSINIYLSDVIKMNWENYKLGDLVEIVSGESPSSFKLSDNGKYPYIKVEDLNNCEKYQFESREYLDEESRMIPINSIIFPKRGAAITTNKVRINAVPLQMDSNLMAIYPKSKKLYFDYLFYFIKNEKLYKIADTSTIPQINNKHILPYIIPLPPFPEQKAIATCLSTWDSAIQKLTELIAKKELRKKWLMQVLLTGKKRLKGFNSSWKLSSLEKFITPISRSVEKPREPYLALGIRSHGKGTFLKENEIPDKNSMDKLFVVKENDLVVNITFAWEMAIAIATKQDDGALVSHRFPTFTFNPEIGIASFFKFFILMPVMKNRLDLISPGGAGRNRVLNKSDFLKLEFRIPEYKEQIAIANIIQSADNELNLLKENLERMKEQKSGLMQVLLTGKTRLINNP